MTSASAQVRPLAERTNGDLVAAFARPETGLGSEVGEIYRRYRAPVLGYLRYIGRDPESAEDAIQDLFVALPRKLHGQVMREGGIGRLSLWLKACARRMSDPSQRPNIETHTDAVKDLGVFLANLNDHAPRPDRRLLDEQLLRLAFTLVAKLSPRKRQWLTLREVEGASAVEIAAEFGVPRSTVTATLAEARHDLADLARGTDLEHLFRAPKLAAMTSEAKNLPGTVLLRNLLADGKWHPSSALRDVAGKWWRTSLAVLARRHCWTVERRGEGGNRAGAAPMELRVVGATAQETVSRAAAVHAALTDGEWHRAEDLGPGWSTAVHTLTRRGWTVERRGVQGGRNRPSTLEVRVSESRVARVSRTDTVSRSAALMARLSDGQWHRAADLGEDWGHVLSGLKTRGVLAVERRGLPAGRGRPSTLELRATARGQEAAA